MIHDEFSKTVQLVEQAIVRAQRTPVYASQATCEAAIARTKAHIVEVASGKRSLGRRARAPCEAISLVNSLRESNGAETKKSGNVTRELYLDAERANLIKLENVLGRIKCRS